MNVKLIWNKTFASKSKKAFSKIQDCIDSECVSKMTPYVPVALSEYSNAGKLRDSVKIKSQGEIVYTAPFARSDYYAVKNHTPPHGGNPQGSRLWFEVMKSKHGDEILRGAAAIAGKEFRK
ncbi:MAG: minor capsid protein [Ruminococcus sp.]|nr:minor capsid protein [Ruminococcus sp.]